MHKKTMWSFIITLAIIETLAMSTIEYSANENNYYYIFGILLYGIVAYILYRILVSSKLAITNALWNATTVILVTLVGVFYFKEELNKYECIGIFFAILAVIFMEMDTILKLFH